MTFALLVTNAVTALYLTGLIWFVQVVHYPSFALVGESKHAEYHAFHMRRVSMVVAAPMLVEAACAALLVYQRPNDPWVLIGFALLLVVWLSTFLFQVPCHRTLEQKFDERAARRLVATNWIRTFAWTGRAVAAMGALLGAR